MFTRVIVKGLPGNCTETALRSVFGKCGEVTDCSLKYTKDGKFRRFAYIGFGEESAAAKALRSLNRTCIGSSRITVEECKPFGDETKPRAWSKYAKGSSAYKRAHPEEKEPDPADARAEPRPSKVAKLNGNHKFEEFLEVQNKHVDESSAETSTAVEEKDLVEELLQDISGDTSLSLVLLGLPPTIKQKSVKEWLSPIRMKGVKIVRNSSSAAAFVTFGNRGDVKKALTRDGQFIGGFKVKATSVSDLNSPVGNAKFNEEEPVYESREAELESVTSRILETGRLFVRNLPYSCTEDDLQFLFKKFGEVAEVQVIINKKTNQCKGFAIVTYVFPENAVAAYSSLDGTIFKGRMMHILPGDDKKEKTVEDDQNLGAKSSFQKEKMAKLKANAGKAHSWNSLFLGANAVADTLAAKLQVEKSDLLSSEGETSAGVRLALAETRLVRETREFLLSHGVCLDAFSRPAAKRSDTVVIVKNLPANVEVEELRRMFERFGALKKALMPPDGVTALIEMENTVDARKAFNSLAYSRFRTQPLYLEWAPIDVFKKAEKFGESEPNETEGKNHVASKEAVDSESEKPLTSEEKKSLRRSKKHRELEAVKVEVKTEENEDESSEEHDRKVEIAGASKPEVREELVEDGENEEAEIGPGTTVFVKNLNFSTTEEALKNRFATKYKVRKATISRKRDIKDPSLSLSMGFGFVQFYYARDAQNAIKEMQGVLLDGHCLELKLSNREEQKDESHKRKEVHDLEQGDRTKIHVKNIPFQATRKEVKQLFATFGELRAFRLPRKAGGSTEGHRGFGFVDYLTRADARRAFEELAHSTHFYGKRLVLEWAKTDEDIEELREKALSNFRADKKEAMKRKKKLREIEKDLAAIDDD